MKAFVDGNTCISCGLCEGICPEIFSLETGISIVKEEDVPEEYVDATREACDSCPVDAISVEE